MKRGKLKCATFLLLFITIFTYSLTAQDAAIPNFFGINPSVTVEPFYNKGELDVNIFPIVYQRPVSKRSDIRLSGLLNLGIRNSGNSISHIGFDVALPVFLKAKEERSQLSKGFFVAPVVGLSRNRMEEHTNLGLWLEPGYHILFENRFALSLGVQVGGTYFRYDDGDNKWGNHFGIKVIFGKWFN